MTADVRSSMWPRISLLILCAVCAILATWIIIAEIQRPPMVRLPLDAQEAWRAHQQRGRAEAAASFALVRGDLWAESGFTYANLLWADEAGAGLDARARSNLERALRFSPHRGDVWLTLAGLATRYKWQDARTDAL